MTDITMCSGENCPVKKTCYRFKAKPNELHQSYFLDPPFDKEEKKCDYYWEDKK